MPNPIFDAMEKRAEEMQLQKKQGMDRDGRPLNSYFIAGGSGLSNSDVSGLSRILADSVTTYSDPKVKEYAKVTARRPQQGNWNLDYSTNEAARMNEMVRQAVGRHETSHLIDFRSGLFDSYNRLDDQTKKTLAKQFYGASQQYNRSMPHEAGVSGYSSLTSYHGNDPRETLADFIAYATQDPDGAAAAFPEAYKWLRNTVNTNPEMNNILTFSSLDAPLGALTAFG